MTNSKKKYKANIPSHHFCQSFIRLHMCVSALQIKYLEQQTNFKQVKNQGDIPTFSTRNIL